MKSYWIIFSNGENTFAPFLRSGFRHCSILTHDQYNWILFEPTNKSFEYTILPYDLDANVPKLIKSQHPQATIVGVTMKEACFKRMKRFPLGVRSCVTLIKYMMGLSLFCLTPYHLFRRLLKIGNKNCAKYGISKIHYVL